MAFDNFWSLKMKGIVALLIVLAVFISCSKEQSEKEPAKESSERKPVSEAQRTFDVIFDKADGGHARLAEFRGKIVLLNFWAAWHNDSRELIPIMNALQKKFKRHVTVVGVLLDKNGAAALKGFELKQPIGFRVFINGEKVARKFGGTSELPTTYIILRDGRIFECIAGLRRKKVYEEKIIDLLKRRM